VLLIETSEVNDGAATAARDQIILVPHRFDEIFEQIDGN